jgi:hypothetical protein
MFIIEALSNWLKRRLDATEPPLRDEDNLSGGAR